MKAAERLRKTKMHFKTTAAVAALCACGLLAGCTQQQASAPAPQAPAAGQPAAPAATEQTSLTPNQGPPAAADTSPDANKKFLADNGKRDGVKTTQDGLQYRVIKAGTGKAPTAPTDNVTVLYKGQLITGQVFDQTQEGMPATFPAGALIPGWVEALQMMKEGDEWELVSPAELGYGEAGAGGVIPPNQTLVFQMALLKVAPEAAPPP
jgi:FKBP-type peptidyl-prolyl cis-trans isomerase